MIKRFSQFLTEKNRELVKTDLKGAIKYAHKKFSEYGNKLYDLIPDFDKNYEFAQIHATEGHTQRKDMPVIRRADIAKFKKEMDDHGIKTKHMKVEVGSLRPIQQQIYISKSIDAIAEFGIKKSLQFLKDKKTVTVMSKDHYIIDGHHRFLTGMLIDPKMKVNVLMIDMPISELLPSACNFSDCVGNVRNESMSVENQNKLNEATDFIDDMDNEEFEQFLIDCS